MADRAPRSAGGLVALVTGANRGIGKETARGLAERGASVVLSARDAVAGSAAAGSMAADGLDVHSVVLDVTEQHSIDQAAAWIDERFGRLDILVNNAGVLHELDFPAPSEVSIEHLRATYEVNTFGPIAVIQAMLPLLRRGRRPRIVNVTSALASLSAASQIDGPGLTLLAYNSSKAALNAATLQFVRELRGTPIKVNLADPMHCATDINNFSGARTPAAGSEIIIQLALLDGDGPTGAFMNANGPIAW